MNSQEKTNDRLVEIIVAFVIMVLFFTLFFWPELFFGKKIVEPNQTIKTIETTSTESRVSISEAVVVKLPPNETFLYIIPRSQAQEMVLNSRGGDVYVTRAARGASQRVTFWGPGASPHTWEPILYIQEQ